MGIESLTAAGIGSLLSGGAAAAGGVSQLAQQPPPQAIPRTDLSVPQAPPIMPLPQLGGVGPGQSLPAPQMQQNDLLGSLMQIGGR